MIYYDKENDSPKFSQLFLQESSVLITVIIAFCHRAIRVGRLLVNTI